MATPPKIDWEAARQHWLSQDPPRSFSATARAFQVTPRGVSYRAHADGWLEDAAWIDREARRAFMRRAPRERARRLADRELLLDEMLTAAWEDAVRGRLDAKASDIPGLIKAEQLLLGLATDRLEVGHMRMLAEQLVHPTVAIMRNPELTAEQRVEGWLQVVETVVRQLPGSTDHPAILEDR